MALSEADRKFILDLKYDDISYTLIEGTFCNHYDIKTKKMVPPKISFQEEFDLKPGEYINKEKVHTNVGQLILNKALYGNCPNIQKVLGYVAKPYKKGVIKETEDIMVKAILEGKITVDEYSQYLNNIQWFGNAFNAQVSASFTPNSTRMLPSVKKKKEELYKKYKKELDNGDVVSAVKITDELLKDAKEELKHDPGMQVYDSGAKPAFGNSYRAMFATRGPQYNPVEDRFDISKNSFVEGMEKKEIPSYANSVINGAYPKAIGTSVAGYETKKLFACYQAIHVGPKGSDCHSKKYRQVYVTEKNKHALLKRYQYVNGKLKCLEAEDLNKLVGQTILIRSPLYCTSKNGEICNICAGEMPYTLGIRNLGMSSSALGGGLLNLLMKSFHDTTQKLVNVDLDRMIIE